MLSLRPLVAQCLCLRWEMRALCHSRLLHKSRKCAGSFKRLRLRASPLPSSKRPSLLEELFPEEAQKDDDRDPKFYDDVQNVPRLPLPDIDNFPEEFDHEPDREKDQPKRMTKVAAANAFRQQQLAVLSLDAGSKSLVESDFRRIAPKGQHIDDWTGPGDILKSGLRKENHVHKVLVSLPVSKSYLCETLRRWSQQVATSYCSQIPHTLEHIRIMSSACTE